MSDSVRAFLDEPRFAVPATINKSGTPQLTVMWYALAPDSDVIILNSADRSQQEREVNELIAPRYIGRRLGAKRWEVIKDSDRIGIHMRVDRVHARGV